MRVPTFRTGNRCLSSFPLLDFHPAIITTTVFCYHKWPGSVIGLQMVHLGRYMHEQLLGPEGLKQISLPVMIRCLMITDLSSWFLIVQCSYLTTFRSLPDGRRLFVTLLVA